MHFPAPGKIDVHHHIRPPGSAAAGLREWSATSALEDMEANGIGFAVTYPGFVAESSEMNRSAPDQARSINEFSANLSRAYPTRFGMYATLPMSDVEQCLDEIAYCSDVLGCAGFAMVTSYGDKWLGDPAYEPIFDELNRRRAVVFVHPTDFSSSPTSYGSGQVTGPWLEWPTSTARTILNLILTGTLRKNPDIKFIFCHGGGVMPMIVSRIAGFTGWREMGKERMKELFPEGIHSQFASLNFELAQAFAPENFHALNQLVPSSRMLFGSDWDNFEIGHSVRSFDSLNLDTETSHAISRGNALRLFECLTETGAVSEF
ncbi:amidohydrolase [Streptomyces chartreusis]|uniref:Amidohydrolase n=2 Tax=Streptomyces chartreusis TaxID=1969 RepID=A0A7I0NSJ2_STRCX|nr:amidohydrolase [Streptomyces chartreusis]